MIVSSANKPDVRNPISARRGYQAVRKLEARTRGLSTYMVYTTVKQASQTNACISRFVQERQENSHKYLQPTLHAILRLVLETIK